MRGWYPAISFGVVLTSVVSAASAQPLIKIQHDELVPASVPAVGDLDERFDWAEARQPGIELEFVHTAAAWHNQPMPGGGWLTPMAFMNPAGINDAGQIVFVSTVRDVQRNQGVFVADERGLTPIAVGCGGGGGSGDPGSGCGDPSPIGGTFAGFFRGTFFAPAINDFGDVLFLADVDGGA